MKQILCGILGAVLLGLPACGTPEAPSVGTDTVSASPETPPTSSVPAEAPVETSVVLTVGDRQFTVTLQDSETAHALMGLIRLTLDMSELNGNEKYFYLDNNLPTDSYRPGQINVGDLMLYGDNCLVLFYESFSSSYSYTRLGCVDDPTGLAEALGEGGVTVTFSAVP